LLQPRHEYAADLRHGLRAGHEIPATESPSPPGTARTVSRPTSARLEPMPRLRGFNQWLALAAPSRLACRTQAVWRYRPVPSLSGCSHPRPALPRPVAGPSLNDPLRRAAVSHPTRSSTPRGALRARGTPGQPRGRPTTTAGSQRVATATASKSILPEPPDPERQRRYAQTGEDSSPHLHPPTTSTAPTPDASPKADRPPTPSSEHAKPGPRDEDLSPHPGIRAGLGPRVDALAGCAKDPATLGLPGRRDQPALKAAQSAYRRSVGSIADSHDRYSAVRRHARLRHTPSACDTRRTTPATILSGILKMRRIRSEMS
jgi:hypothetical protein